MHNVHYLLDLMAKVRDAIIGDRFPGFIMEFFGRLYEDKAEYPLWAVDALRGVGVDLLG